VAFEDSTEELFLALVSGDVLWVCVQRPDDCLRGEGWGDLLLADYQHTTGTW